MNFTGGVGKALQFSYTRAIFSILSLRIFYLMLDENYDVVVVTLTKVDDAYVVAVLCFFTFYLLG